MKTRQQEYEEYIRSDAWKKKRLQRLEFDKHECQTCCSKENLQVHHKHYRTFRNENMNDLITLCSECHDAITTVFRRRRYDLQELVVTEYKDIRPERIISCDSGDESTPNGSSAANFAQWADGESSKPLCKRD